MKILWTGDIVGSPGRRIYKNVVRELKARGEIQAAVCNAENAAAGSGITEALAKELLDAGADVLTLGDHVWNQKDTAPFLAKEHRVLRPANLPAACPGVGYVTVQTALCPLTVVSVLGRVFMQPAECPFLACDAILKKLPAGNGPVLIEIHAEATSEKQALGYYADGRVSAVVGTHTHVQTSDETILSGGTGYITDLGMTGPNDSVLGVKKELVIEKFRNHMPVKFDTAKGECIMGCCLFDIDEKTGKTTGVKRLLVRE